MSGPQRTLSQGHSRNKSVTKSRPRSSTKGPLDIDDDPLTASSTPKSSLSPPPSAPRRTSRSPGARLPVTQVGQPQAKDFSFLLKPEIYHPLPPQNIPAAFRNSDKQPGPEVPLEELLERGHLRAAAIAAVQELTGSGATGAPDPTDSKRIFELLYTRLACLTLIDATQLAAQEVKALEDLNNTRLYVDETTGEHLVPWELRVLNVRLQALGFGDMRRSIMSYHDLARESRSRIAKATDDEERQLWKARLHQLGVKVAGALVEMNDAAGAAAHLNGLHENGDGKMALSKALVWLQLGDVDNARRCAEAHGDAETVGDIILALCDMADTQYEAALERWEALREKSQDEMVGVNAAVCLLYLGRLQEGREIMEELVNSGFSSHTLLFNLSTVYELCADKNRNLKMALTERTAAMAEGPAGWEKQTADFKL